MDATAAPKPRQVKLFAISTCAWCKKTKRLLDDNEISYEATDVDMLSGDDKEQAREVVRKHNPRVSYPTLIVDDTEVVVGYDEDRIKELLGI